MFQHEPRNLKREISPNNTKLKQEPSILVSTSIVQILFDNVIAMPWRFLFSDYWDRFEQVNVGWWLATKSIKSKITPRNQLRTFRTSFFKTNCQKVTNWQTQLAFISSKTTTETLEKGWKMFKVNNKNTRTTLMTSFWYFYC